ncbi:MAG: DUF5780 domain-containing protein [Eubacterium sp.]
MICRKCSNEIDDNALYCQHCGAKNKDAVKANTPAQKIKRKKTITIVISVAVAVALAAAGIVCGVLYSKSQQNASDNSADVQQGETEYADNASLDALLSSQPLMVTGTKYLIAGTNSQLAYDAISADVLNNSDVNIASFELSFCAWDSAGQPIMITQPEEAQEPAYIRTIKYDFANNKSGQTSLAPGASFGNAAIYVSTDPQIITVKACVKSYVSTDGITWENPYYENFMHNYANQPLSAEPVSETTTASAPQESTTATDTATQDTTTAAQTTTAESTSQA